MTQLHYLQTQMSGLGNELREQVRQSVKYIKSRATAAAADPPFVSSEKLESIVKKQVLEQLDLNYEDRLL